LYETPACVSALTVDRLPGERVWDRGLPVRPAHTPLGEGAPLGMMLGNEPERGYNPMDILRYKEYLQFIGDEDRPLVPLRDTLTYPVMGDLPAIHNKPLADLLGVRYLMQPSEWSVEGAGWRQYAEDASPTVPGFLPEGQQKLPPYTVWENTTALPRAFVVSEAMVLPADRPEALRALKETDFRRRVLLEGIDADATIATSTEDSATASSTHRPVVVRAYRPNRVALSVPDGSAGYLVLTDIWYPGWECTIDGQPARILRANYLFRAVELPAGPHDVVFTFVPQSYRHGRTISLATLALAALILTGAAIRKKQLTTESQRAQRKQEAK
jgi:Bacterial membrane protein YfhO